MLFAADIGRLVLMKSAERAFCRLLCLRPLQRGGCIRCRVSRALLAVSSSDVHHRFPEASSVPLWLLDARSIADFSDASSPLPHRREERRLSLARSEKHCYEKQRAMAAADAM